MANRWLCRNAQSHLLSSVRTKIQTLEPRHPSTASAPGGSKTRNRCGLRHWFPSKSNGLGRDPSSALLRRAPSPPGEGCPFPCAWELSKPSSPAGEGGERYEPGEGTLRGQRIRPATGTLTRPCIRVAFLLAASLDLQLPQADREQVEGNSMPVSGLPLFPIPYFLFPI
jgi:hypothetical protein